jgi:hypothetical protein
MDATPASVLELDDRAVASALAARQARADRQRRAAAEAARERERAERDSEAGRVLNRARLCAFYRAYNPERIDTIDQILKLFDGRMGVLNEKQRNKVRGVRHHCSAWAPGRRVRLQLLSLFVGAPTEDGLVEDS